MNATPTKSGWHVGWVTDLHTDVSELETCERCGRTDLRFVHIARHPTEGELRVGSECARRLCFGYSPEREEGRLRNLWERRSRWLTRRWGTSWRGNYTLTFPHGSETARVTVFPRPVHGWGYCVSVGGQREFSPCAFETSEAAKLAAFDVTAALVGWSNPIPHRGGTI